MTAAPAQRGQGPRTSLPCVIERMTAFPVPGFESLLRDSLLDGHAFLQRLLDEWNNGRNRFNRQGEVLYGARVGSSLAGVCGRNVDPYAEDARRGRLRHLYVRRGFRGRHVATELVQAVVRDAAIHFDLIALRTENPAADALYRQLGFTVALESGSATHVLRLTG